MSSTYCTQSDIEDIFGSSAVDKWAAVNATDGSTEKAARITRAIAFAGDRIDDILRQTPYKIPIATSASATPTSIENIAATLAGVWLYEIRGIENVQVHEGIPMHRLYFAKTDAMSFLEKIRTGAVKLNAVTG